MSPGMIFPLGRIDRGDNPHPSPRVFQWLFSGNQWKPSGIQCLRPVVPSTNLDNSELELHWPLLVIQLVTTGSEV
jgi:hypothetical protein